MQFHYISAVLFVFALVMHLLLRRSGRPVLWLGSYILFAIGFIFLTGYLYERGSVVRACPLGNTFEIVSFISWSGVLIYLLIGPLFRMTHMGLFIAALLTLCNGLLYAFPGLNAPYDHLLNPSTTWIEFHASLAIFSYGAFALQFLLAVMYLLQYQSLTAKKPHSFFEFLPPLLKLERISLVILVVGFLLLYISLFVGSFTWFTDQGDVSIKKWVISITVCLLYLGLLVARLTHRLIADKFAWLSIVIFLVAVISLIPLSPTGASEPAGTVASQVSE